MNGWVNTCETDDLRRHRAHCDVIVMDYIHGMGLDGPRYVSTLLYKNLE